MKNRQLAFTKSGLGLALCFLLIGSGYSHPVHASETTVAINQQSRKVTGTVTDARGETLLGVNVVVQGTTTGTITDLDGNFSLEAEPNAVLVFSYIGYITQAVPATNTVMNVVLREDSQALDEVVVVGYGTQQKKDITGSVAVVDTKDLLASTGSSATQQLQGKAAGVFIGTSGAPGSATMVRIRGINTVNDNGPLYVIDGVSTRDQDLSSINPNDIESMQILKDASSAAIYGSQAANGVILITTKKGTQTGQPRLTYDGYFGVSKTATQYDVLNSYDRLDIEWKAQKNNLDLSGASANGELPSHAQFGTQSTSFVNHIPNYLTVTGAGGVNQDPSNYSYPNSMMAAFSDTDWWDEISQNGLIQNHQLSIAGGTEKGQYNLGLNYYNQEGTIIETYYTRYQVRANTSFNIRPWLRVGETLTFSHSKDNGLTHYGGESTGYSWTYRASPWVPVYDIEGNFAGSKLAGTGNWQNPVANQVRNKDNFYNTNRIFGSVFAEADLYKGLTFKSNFGLDYRNSYQLNMSKDNPEFSETTGQNYLEETSYYNYRWVWTNTLTYNTRIAEDHNLTVLVGTEAIRDGLGRELKGRRYNYLFDEDINTWTLEMGENNSQRVVESSYNGEYALFGIFGRIDYGYKDKYLLTGIIRRDGVSRFSQNHRYGIFPSISAGWRISEESFLESTRDWLDDLKVRVGYGETGNSEILVATNFSNMYTTDTKKTNYDFTGANTSGSTGYRLETYGNRDTKWESNKMVNLGLDMTFGGGKFSTTLELYSKKTSNMLVQASYGNTAGESSKPYVNFGSITNKGIDFMFNYRDRKGDWGWDLSFNAATYKNRVDKLGESDDYSLYGGGTRIEGDVTRTTKGRAISEFYGYKQVGFYETAQEVMETLPVGYGNLTLEEAEAWVGKFKFADLNGDGKLDENDRTFIGSPHPDVTLGLNATVTWKNWDLTMFWYSTIGNELFNNTKYFTDFWMFAGNKSSRMRDLSWSPGADNSKAILPYLDSGDEYSGKYVSSYFVENASFLRLKNVVLGYTFPKEMLSKLTIQNLRLYVQIENLFTITGYSGLDPEFTNAYLRQSDTTQAVDLRKGVDMGGWPTTRKFLFGVNFAF